MEKNKKLKIGIIGCGAIGTSLAKIIVRDFSQEALLAGLFDIQPQRNDKLASILKNSSLASKNLNSLIGKSDLIIEATSPKAVFEIAQKSILAARDIIILSVGGIVNKYSELRSLARKNGADIFIPSGAICGVDGLKAAACGKISKVTLTTSKPPSAFSGVAYLADNNIQLVGIKDDTLLFEGSAREAIKFFPQNINVAATLSLAGIGPKNTCVRIIASRRIKQNMHEVRIESDSGTIITRTQNLIHPDNPKTSYLAVLSAAACLRQVLDPIKIGT